MRALAVAALLLALAGVAPAAELKIGLIPEQNLFKQRERYEPLGRYLAKKTGVPIRFTTLSRYGNLLAHFTDEAMDGAFFGSFTGALAIRKLGVIPLARPVNLDGTSTYTGYLFARRDSGIRTVAEMKGKRLALVERATTAGYLYPVVFFKEHGIARPEEHFREVYFAGSHDAAVHAVLEGTADVGAAKHSVFDHLARKQPRVGEELVVLARSPAVPSNGLCVRPGLDEGLRRRLTQALLAMESDAEGRLVLQAFEALRFVPAEAADYAGVIDLAARAGIDLATYEYDNR
ncbi:MAG: phosphate/phosphite/phosphonate ABC transporter substrate-binding protein [Deferrisomatales bacterium]